MTLELVDEHAPDDSLSQDRRMRKVLVAMQLLMYGPAMNWDPSTSGGKATGGACPPGESQPLHTIWQQAYVLAAPEDREQVIADATDALVIARRRVTPVPQGETPEQWEHRLLVEGEGFEARDVAVRFNTGVRVVCKLRMRDDRDPERGRKLPDARTVTERAKQLAADGLTARQIAHLTGLKPATAQYHVNRARRAA